MLPKQYFELDSKLVLFVLYKTDENALHGLINFFKRGKVKDTLQF